MSNQDWQQAVFRSRILPLHSLRIVSLSEFEEAYRILENMFDGVIKVVIMK